MGFYQLFKIGIIGFGYAGKAGDKITERLLTSHIPSPGHRPNASTRAGYEHQKGRYRVREAHPKTSLGKDHSI